MRHTILHYSVGLLAALSALLLATSCEEKESELGSALVDPATLYNGIRDTVYLEGYTIYDDSLLTSDYSEAVIGRHDDATVGNTRCYLYSQIAISDNNGLNITEGTQVDSAILSLVVSDLYTTSTATTHSLHIKIHQLAEAIANSSYYAGDTVATDYSTCFYDGTVDVENNVQTLTLKLNSNIYDLLVKPGQSITSSQFLEDMKGVRIEMNDSDSEEPVVLTLNMNASNTRVTVYCSKDSATTNYSFIFGHQVGLTTKHFNHFKHKFEGSTLARFATEDGRNDTIGGSSHCYLKPMGGARVVYMLDTAWYNNFKAKHPYAILNYAELLLPVASGDTTTLPKRLLAYKGAGRDATLVSDATDGARYTGFDGSFHTDRKCYRMQIVRHLQQILMAGTDPGTTIAIDGRRSTPRNAVLNGTSQADRPRIAFIYSE